MKKIFTLILSIGFLFTQAQIGGGWDWAFNTGSLGGTTFKHLKYTSDGAQIMMAGQSAAAAYFGSTTLTAPPQLSFPGNIKFFGKINAATGASTVIRSFINIPINFDCITTDDAGNFYIGGASVTTTDFDFGNGVTIPGSAFKMGVIAKFDAMGNTIWAKTFQMGALGSSNNQILKLAVANSGNIFFWGLNLNSGNSPLYKLDNNGNTLWFKDALNGRSSVGNTFKEMYLSDKFIDKDENVHLFVSTSSASGYAFDGVSYPIANASAGSSTLISLNASGTLTKAQTFAGGVSHFQVNRTNGNLIFGWNQFYANPGAFQNLPHPFGTVSPIYADAFTGMMETDKNLNFIKPKDYSTVLDNPFQATGSDVKFLSLLNGKLLIAMDFVKTGAYAAGVNSFYPADATKYASVIIETDSDWNMDKFITGGKAPGVNQTFLAAYNDTYILGAGFYAQEPGYGTVNPPLPTTSFGNTNLTGFNAAADMTTAYGNFSTSSSLRYDVALAQTKSPNFPSISSTTWLGTTNNWNTSGNWSNGVPTNAVKALFTAGAANYPAVFSSPTAATLEIGTGVTLSLPANLTLVGGVKNDGVVVLNNAGFFQGLGSLEWKGTGSVNFTGTSVSFFYGKTFTNSLILNADVNTFYNLTVPSVTFISGKLNLNNKKSTITDANTTAISGANANSYFYGGILERKINGTGIYEFPVGSSTNFQSATVNANGLVGVTNIGVTHNSGAVTGTTPNTTSGAVPITGALNGGWFSINTNAQPTAGNYNVTLQIKGSTNTVSNVGNYTVIKRNNSTSTWAVAGAYSLATLNSGTVTATNIGLTNFSDFAIGIGASVLPVTLSSFTATEKNGTAILNWTTASELNNKGYNIQRSSDGVTFTNIGFVNGKGNSTINTRYSFTDFNPAVGINYYRLQAVDFDGKSTLSKIESIEIKILINAISFYPNPTSSVLNIVNNNKISSLELFDISGRKIKSFTQTQTIIDMGMYTNGVYILKALLTSGEMVEEKIILKK